MQRAGCFKGNNKVLNGIGQIENPTPAHVYVGVPWIKHRLFNLILECQLAVDGTNGCLYQEPRITL